MKSPEAEVLPRKYSSILSSGFFSAKSFKFISEHPVIVEAKIPINTSFLNTILITQFTITRFE
jgi:hypothetical protein